MSRDTGGSPRATHHVRQAMEANAPPGLVHDPVVPAIDVHGVPRKRAHATGGLGAKLVHVFGCIPMQM